LSQRRAEAVAAYLSANGIDPDRLSAIGYGESAPVAPNDTAENMYKNRRVDLVVTDN
jgi:chemotaxis protein MotB